MSPVFLQYEINNTKTKIFVKYGTLILVNYSKVNEIQLINIIYCIKYFLQWVL
jgi:hypothetical protein